MPPFAIVPLCNRRPLAEYRGKKLACCPRRTQPRSRRMLRRLQAFWGTAINWCQVPKDCLLKIKFSDPEASSPTQRLVRLTNLLRAPVAPELLGSPKCPLVLRAEPIFPRVVHGKAG